MKCFIGRIFLIAIVFLMAVTVWADDTPQQQKKSAGETINMTLADAVSLALRSNRDIAITYLGRVIQKYNLRIAEAEFLPNIRMDIAAGSTYTDTYTTTMGSRSKVLTESMEAGATVSATQKLPTGAQFTFSWENQNTDVRTKTDGSSVSASNTAAQWSLDLSQPLLKGGGLEYTRAALVKARLTEQENLLGLRDSISSTIVSVIAAYNSFYQSSRNVKIRRAALEEAKKQLETNKILVKAGRMATNELIQSEAQVADQEFSYEEAINTLDTNLLTLIDILDIGRETNIVPADDVFLRELTPDFKTCLDMALKSNGSYIKALNNVSRRELELMEEENSRLWDLSLSAGYEENYDTYPWRGNADDDKGRDWNVGLNLTVPFELYGNDRLVKRRRLLQAKKNLKVVRLNMEEARGDLETNVLNAVRNVHTQLKLLARSRKSLDLATQRLAVEKTKLNVGRSTLFQVVSFQNSLVDKQEAEVNQTISYLTSLTTLDKLLGTTLDTWNIEIQSNSQALEQELMDYR